jgi:hypothetical protein
VDAWLWAVRAIHSRRGPYAGRAMVRRGTRARVAHGRRSPCARSSRRRSGTSRTRRPT